MKNGQIIGLILLIGGFVSIYLYSIVRSFQEVNIATFPLMILFGIIAIIIGLIALFISVFFEQKKDMKKRREEIKKEDFEP
jgi:uncharacterized membrane protein